MRSWGGYPSQARAVIIFTKGKQGIRSGSRTGFMLNLKKLFVVVGGVAAILFCFVVLVPLLPFRFPVSKSFYNHHDGYGFGDEEEKEPFIHIILSFTSCSSLSKWCWGIPIIVNVISKWSRSLKRKICANNNNTTLVVEGLRYAVGSRGFSGSVS